MITLDPKVRETLDSSALAHVATVLPDGGPHVVPVWIGMEGDNIVFFTGAGSRKAQNLARDPRVCISMTPTDNPFFPISIRGRLVDRIEGDAAWTIIDRISTTYTGGPYSREHERIVLVVEPEKVAAGLG
jgi:PPOX class probable F420-dependent enzyme